jgi:hypothetical protein
MRPSIPPRPFVPARLACAGLVASALTGLPGCIVVPVTTTGYDPHCRTVTHQVVLQPVQIGAIQACANQGCQVLVLAAAVSVAASTIVSGSIAIAGNVAYWAEERASCRPADAAPVTPPAAAALRPSATS